MPIEKDVLDYCALSGVAVSMKRALYLLLVVSSASLAQVRVDKLVIDTGETYYVHNTDIIVADTLIMMDSSRIVLNKLREENYLRARVAIVGQRCVIDGRGVAGVAGRDGAPGISPAGPCMMGTKGGDGGRGLDGKPGLHLFIYFDSLTVNGKLTIDLSGGNGGDGGDGGQGGGGSPGTRHCKGGDGGPGGNGGHGGSGGRGGNLTVGGDHVETIRVQLRAGVTVLNKGGSFGYGGIAGPGGPPGLGPAGKNGSTGPGGTDGDHGQPATNGTVLFDE